MGNQDNWTTPKQIKIERKGEPKGCKRGVVKKGERKKGKKARIDEILSAKRNAVMYVERLRNDWKRQAEHPEWYTNPNAYNPHYERYLALARVKLFKLRMAAVEDGILTPEEAKQYVVALPIKETL